MPRRFGADLSRREVVLPVLRAISASWFAAIQPYRSADVRGAAEAASTAADSASRGRNASFAATAAAAAAAAAAIARLSTAAYSAADAVAYTADAAVYAAGDAGAIEDVWAAVSADASELERENALRPADLAIQELWPIGIPQWVGDNWATLKIDLLALNEDWDVWIDWYDARLFGAKQFGPPDEGLELARVQIDEEIWTQGPKVVNAHIKSLLQSPEQKLEQVIFNYTTADAKETIVPPKVPARKPAALEPVWQGDRLTLPKRTAKLDLGEVQFVAALAALRSELRELASDVAAEANIDKRPAHFLERFAERIPAAVPSHEDLFRLGHVETVLIGFTKTITEEWPDFLAARYQSLMLQFDRTMRQSAVWREFRSNAAKETLSAEQVADAELLAREAADALSEEGSAEFIDGSVPDGLRRLAASLSDLAAENDEASEAINRGAELLASDLIESINNILKPIAEVALEAARDYSKGFGKGFKAAAKRQGSKDGEKAFKWLRRIVVSATGVAAIGGGSFAGLSVLLAKYPHAFEWLGNVLRYLY